MGYKKIILYCCFLFVTESLIQTVWAYIPPTQYFFKKLSSYRDNLKYVKVTTALKEASDQEVLFMSETIYAFGSGVLVNRVMDTNGNLVASTQRSIRDSFTKAAVADQLLFESDQSKYFKQLTTLKSHLDRAGGQIFWILEPQGVAENFFRLWFLQDSFFVSQIEYPEQKIIRFEQFQEKNNFYFPQKILLIQDDKIEIIEEFVRIQQGDRKIFEPLDTIRMTDNSLLQSYYEYLR